MAGGEEIKDYAFLYFTNLSQPPPLIFSFNFSIFFAATLKKKLNDENLGEEYLLS